MKVITVKLLINRKTPPAFRSLGTLAFNRDPAFIGDSAFISTMASSTLRLILLFVPSLMFILLLLFILTFMYLLNLRNKELSVSTKFSGRNDVTSVWLVL